MTWYAPLPSVVKLWICNHKYPLRFIKKKKKKKKEFDEYWKFPVKNIRNRVRQNIPSLLSFRDTSQSPFIWIHRITILHCIFTLFLFLASEYLYRFLLLWAKILNPWANNDPEASCSMNWSELEMWKPLKLFAEKVLALR